MSLRSEDLTRAPRTGTESPLTISSRQQSDGALELRRGRGGRPK